MPYPLPTEAPTALQYFESLVADDASFATLEAAVAVAQDDEPALDVQGTLADIDALADRLIRRLPGDAAPLHRLRLLNQYFFQDLGFSGNVNNYYDRANSSVPAVLRTRRGIPLTLALLYIEIANQIGLQAQGVSFPGHFLVKLHMPLGEVVIDPFTGRSLDRAELEDRLSPFRLRRGLPEEEDTPLGLFLQAAAPRDILARLLRNLKEIHRTAGDLPRLALVLQRLTILLPTGWEEQRDWALVLARLGRHDRACLALSSYLQHRPEAHDASALRRELAVWQNIH